MIYTVSRDSQSHSYHHIHISVYTKVSLDRSWPKPVVKFEWQGDRDNSYWYGFSATSEQDELAAGAEKMRLASGILAKLDKAGVNRNDPSAVIATLGLDRLVNDDRAGEWIPIEKAKPADWFRFMALDGDQCVVSCVAEDEKQATPLLMREFTRLCDSSYYSPDYYTGKLEAWILAGKPIRMDGYRKAPEVRPLDELLKPMKEPTVEVVVVTETQLETVAA